MPQTIYRKDYQSYPFEFKHVHLCFELEATHTVVQSEIEVLSKSSQAQDLVLSIEDIEVLEVAVDGQVLAPSDYELSRTQVRIPRRKGAFKVAIKSSCNPATNSTLMGLYQSGTGLYTQCEAEGFRRITPFADRPDVMSLYTVTIRGSKKDYPYMLSNGNLIAQRDLEDGRHETVWEDPFLKPCYLFALVAGDFDLLERRTTTKSGREVLLQLYSDRGCQSQTEWAMESLEHALKWDEKRFDLELDLDRFMVVAAQDFNMGAMENKGLNIFNAAYVLANPQLVTDATYEGIESVIGHEYFHNWTGNRVTCRDWFQLTLKEGLTVFRDQEFSADMMAGQLPVSEAQSARTVKRIDDIRALKTAQFPEDAGPMAHPIRPESYESIGNFYTATVYEKGAEVIRMYHTLLGEEGFQKGMKVYFARHDGHAVTCDDFLEAMQTVYKEQTGKDLSIFRRWYSQAGTPTVKVRLDYNADKREATLHLSQSSPVVGVEKQRGITHKEPLHIPFAVGFISPEGRSMPLHLNGQTQDTAVLDFTTESASFTFSNVDYQPIPSLLRNFSAPVIVEYDYSLHDIITLAVHDSDPFARYEIIQRYALDEMLRLADCLTKGQETVVSEALIEIWRSSLQSEGLAAAYRAQLLTLPASTLIHPRMSGGIDPVSAQKASLLMCQALGKALYSEFMAIIEGYDFTQPYEPTFKAAGARSMVAVALRYLCCLEDEKALAKAFEIYHQANNMTDRSNALSCICNFVDAHDERRQAALAHFYDQFKAHPTVLDSWFGQQARGLKTTLKDLRELMKDEHFNLRRPNRARALIGGFCTNPHFHAEDGSGYDFWAEMIIQLDTINPEIAARLARIMDLWKQHRPEIAARMKVAVEKAAAGCQSANTQEILQKSLVI